MIKLLAVLIAVFEIGGCYGYKKFKMANTLKSCHKDCIYKKDGYNFCTLTIPEENSKGRCCDEKDYSKCEEDGKYTCTPVDDAQHIKATYCPEIPVKEVLNSAAERKKITKGELNGIY